MHLSEFQNITIKSHHHLDRYVKFIASRDSMRFKETDLIELHHILPCSIFKNDCKTPSNLIKLTTREHFLAHNMLAKAMGGKMWLAFIYMCESRPVHYGRIEVKVNSKTFALAKKEAVKELSALTKINRKNETDSQKLERVEKWKLNFRQKSKEEKDLIFKKCRESRIKNNHPGKVHPISVCEKCNGAYKITARHICIDNLVGCCIICKHHFKQDFRFQLHLQHVSCKSTNSVKVPKVREVKVRVPKVRVPKVRVPKVREVKVPKVREVKVPKVREVKVPKVREVKVPKVRVSNSKIDLVAREKLQAQKRDDKKAEQEKNRLSRICTKCNKEFSAFFHFNNHVKTANCHLSSEEKIALSRKRARETIDNKTIAEKQEMSLKLSTKRKQYLNSLTDTEKILYHQKLRESAISYYESEKYDPVKKSIDVKNGLKNAKN